MLKLIVSFNGIRTWDTSDVATEAATQTARIICSYIKLYGWIITRECIKMDTRLKYNDLKVHQRTFNVGGRSTGPPASLQFDRTEADHNRTNVIVFM